MGQAITVRADFTAGEFRQFAKRAKDAAQARRLLAIAAVLDGRNDENSSPYWISSRLGRHTCIRDSSAAKGARRIADRSWQISGHDWGM